MTVLLVVYRVLWPSRREKVIALVDVVYGRGCWPADALSCVQPCDALPSPVQRGTILWRDLPASPDIL